MTDLVGWALLAHFGAPGTAGAEEMIGHIFDEMEHRCVSRSARLGLFNGGPVSFGWVVSLLRNQGSPIAEATDVSEIEESLVAWLDQDSTRGHFDLITGLVGIGVFALEQARGGMSPLVQGVCARLSEMAETDNTTATWFTPTDVMSPQLLSRFPAGTYDLGMAHGVAGVVAFLARVVMASEDTQAEQLLARSVEWILSQELRDVISAFPNNLDELGRPMGVSRLGWCYGDLSVAISLFAAGAALRDERLTAHSLGLVEGSLERTDETGGIRDGTLCHGAQGLAHIYARFYHVTGDQRFADAANEWVGTALTFFEQGGGIGGVRHRIGGANDVDEWAVRDTVLEGAPGVALSLLALTSDQVPSWDRILLLDLPTPAT